MGRVRRWLGTMLALVLLQVALGVTAMGLDARAAEARELTARECPTCMVTGRCFDVGGLRVCESICVYP